MGLISLLPSLPVPPAHLSSPFSHCLSFTGACGYSDALDDFTCGAAQAGLEAVAILLPQPPEC